MKNRMAHNDLVVSSVVSWSCVLWMSWHLGGPEESRKRLILKDQKSKGGYDNDEVSIVEMYQRFKLLQ